jgi:subtilisin family serine protease
MRLSGIQRWRRWEAGALLVSSVPVVVAADPILMVPDRYIVQRSSRSVAALSAEQVRYTVVKPSKYFDVVAPLRSAISSQSHTTARRAYYNPAKVMADCAEIKKDPTVTTCGPNFIYRISAIPNDSSFSSQWYLDDPSRNADVRAPAAWDRGTGSSEVLIGILDSGNMWSNPNEPVDGLDNDGNGYVDDVLGVNTVTHTSNPDDPNGHGTHVAGIIGARGNNGSGIAGVMWRVSLIGVRAGRSDTLELDGDALIAGLNYFYDLKREGHNVRAVNASWGGGPFDSNLRQAIAQLNTVGVLLVCAAGNSSRSNDTTPHYPSDYDLPNVISVGATGPTKRVSWYSNYGNSVDIAAPGGDSDFGASGYIYSTYRAATPGQGAYRGIQGTSMAAPVVTGAIGLVASQNPALTAAELKSLLLSSADTVSALTPYVNQGRFLNIGAMSSAAAGGNDECPSDPNKVAPGSCGCGVADADANGNGTPDCQDPPDGCPEDSLKAAPGVCGCGVSDDDGNSNGTIDCLDPKVAGVVPLVPAIGEGQTNTESEDRLYHHFNLDLRRYEAEVKNKGDGELRLCAAGYAAVRLSLQLRAVGCCEVAL